MFEQDRIWIAQGDVPCNLLLNQANRHGLIAGASGTGKTVTLKVLAEGFSKAGVPVFMADVKGDVTGIAQAGDDTENIQKRVAKFGIDGFTLEGCPTRFWDMHGDQGIPVRVTVSEMGPVMLSRLLGLTDVQEGVLNVVFRIADDKQMLLIDLKDLRAMLNYVAENAKEYEMTYGRVSSQSVGAILRALISVEDQGGDIFFGEPSLELADWFACDENGRGYVNVLNAAKIISSPQIYSMFLLWMISELFDALPEVGDPDKPKFVFFFDEAHLLFNDMPEELLNKIVQVVKLVRSKGVGIYFITQSPMDIPNPVLAQLSNRIQHGLRAYTPAEQKAVKAAAESFRVNPAFDSEEALQELGTGEALISLLNEEGQPSVVERAKVLPPQCRMAAADPDVIDAVYAAETALMDKYGTAIDRESAYEIITGVGAEEEVPQVNPLTGQPIAAAATGASGVAAVAGVAQPSASLSPEDQLAAERAAFEKEKAEYEKQRAAEEAAAKKAAEKEEAAAKKAAEKEEERRYKEEQKEADRRYKEEQKEADRRYKEEQAAAAAAAKKAEKEKEQMSKTMNSVLGQIGREASRQIIRGIFGSLTK